MEPSVEEVVNEDGSTEMPNAEAAKLAAKIATFAFLVPGVIAFIYFGLSFYRYFTTGLVRFLTLLIQKTGRPCNADPCP